MTHANGNLPGYLLGAILLVLSGCGGSDGGGGGAGGQVTIDVFEVNPDTIPLAGYTTMTWATTGASLVNVNDVEGCIKCHADLGDVAPDDNRQVGVPETTEFVITAHGPGGPIYQYLTLYLAEPGDVVTTSFDAVPETISAGGSSDLTWTSLNGTSASIDNGIGAVAANGIITVSPSETTRYVLVVNGPNGPATRYVVVTVN